MRHRFLLITLFGLGVVLILVATLCLISGMPGRLTPAPTLAVAPRVTAGPPSLQPRTLPPTGLATVVWPKLLRLEPSQVAPGGQFRVMGSGGYRLDPGGGHDESARYFDLYLDGERFGTIACYAGLCVADLAIPGSALPGEHALSVEGGSSLKIRVGDG